MNSETVAPGLMEFDPKRELTWPVPKGTVLWEKTFHNLVTVQYVAMAELPLDCVRVTKRYLTEIGEGCYWATAYRVAVNIVYRVNGHVVQFDTSRRALGPNWNFALPTNIFVDHDGRTSWVLVELDQPFRVPGLREVRDDCKVEMRIVYVDGPFWQKPDGSALEVPAQP